MYRDFNDAKAFLLLLVKMGVAMCKGGSLCYNMDFWHSIPNTKDS